MLLPENFVRIAIEQYFIHPRALAFKYQPDLLSHGLIYGLNIERISRVEASRAVKLSSGRMFSE